jgi:hypothetical protein
VVYSFTDKLAVFGLLATSTVARAFDTSSKLAFAGQHAFDVQ